MIIIGLFLILFILLGSYVLSQVERKVHDSKELLAKRRYGTVQSLKQMIKFPDQVDALAYALHALHVHELAHKAYGGK